MSINSPEAHPYLSDKIIRGSEEYVCGIDNLASILALDMPTVTEVGEAAIQRISASVHPENRPQITCDNCLRKSKLVVDCQANTLLEHGHNHSAPRDSRRSAIGIGTLVAIQT